MSGVSRFLIAVDEPRGSAIRRELARGGASVCDLVPADAVRAGHPIPDDVLVLVLDVRRDTLDASVVAACDVRGVRILPLCADEAARRLSAAFGLASPLASDIDPWALAEVLSAPLGPTSAERASPRAGRAIAVWGAHGAPGRTTLAIEIAAELARGAAHTALIDADSHAPSLALALGIADEGPGFAAACRQAGLGALDEAELARISLSVSTGSDEIDVLTGINRPGRWTELSAQRVGAAIDACRAWADHTVLDVAASLERDEEIVSDLDGPRRNAATIAALQSADLVVAVCAADPVGVARFVRAHAELRATIGPTPVAVVVNRLRAPTMGVDARGQVRRALERLAGVEDAWFVPLDPRSADAALLAARPIAALAPRSPLASAVRRFVGEAITPPTAPPARDARRTRRRA